MSVAFLRRQDRDLIIDQKPVDAADPRDQGSLERGQRTRKAVGRGPTTQRRLEKLDVPRIGIHPLRGLFDADTHLSGLERTERLLLERLEAAIPHQLGHETDVQQRRRIAPPEPTGVGDTDPARFGEREAWVVTTGAGLCPCAGQARVKEQPRAGIDQRVARSPADILLNRKKLLEVTIAGLVLAKIAFSSSRLAERPDRKNEGSANRARHCATEHRPPEPIRRICPKYKPPGRAANHRFFLRDADFARFKTKQKIRSKIN